MRAELESKMETTEMGMIVWMCGVSLPRCRSNWECDKKMETGMDMWKERMMH